ncbi:ABC-three component system protein [Pseudobacteriovorax antillogorgiicola]|uniref:ABC-three component systems C-terminal domain-containing protein n=1 Tax=Pseudobacteriovorax antillogorgiicola TaxID=1513793 RepID=A0A1Y6CSE1_9BACT|nr:ABC-three component system protein [Pseudobacteriovorax antillogorgiicola]TCS45660.1 hypothetical protein EDD56_12754 [Pseudobacteriovorax antillogorgiicola]SMF72965.1 hypothetical protein SAMN06296036_12753 [Pseudobacteriovorax antillogorgiicola]
MSSSFSATDAALGYLYQVRVALFLSLNKLKQEDTFTVSIETLDDVTFGTNAGTPTELLQTKHHMKSAASLTDASPDIWKTLRIWFELKRDRSISSATNLFLMTTSSASDSSAACLLKKEKRNVRLARELLDATARTSTNEKNKRAYEVYLDSTPEERESILSKMVIIDCSSNISSLDQEIRDEIYWAARSEHLEQFQERLEGWWFRRILGQLSEPGSDWVGSVELESQMSDLRDQFKTDSLPIDDDLLDFTLDEGIEETHASFVFVKQLNLISVGKRRVALAIRDYYRAYEQRSRWIRDDLIIDIDLRKYEKKLLDEWEIVFESMRDDIGDMPTEETKKQAAKSVLKWAERTIFHIRQGITEPFISRGSFHILSNDSRIGWHPEFRYKLELILSGQGSSK